MFGIIGLLGKDNENKRLLERKENKLDDKTTWVEIYVMGPRNLCTVGRVMQKDQSTLQHFSVCFTICGVRSFPQKLLHCPAFRSDGSIFGCSYINLQRNTQNKQAILVIKDAESGCVFGLSQASWESLGHQKKTARNVMFKNLQQWNY